MAEKRDSQTLTKLRKAADELRNGPAHHGSYLNKVMMELEEKGHVSIACPHGMGVYKLKLEGSAWYDTVEIIWVNDAKKNSGYGRSYGAGSFSTTEGRAIPWYPKGIGYKGWGETDREDRLQMARMVIGYILAGRRLWKLHCGENINSLNTDDDIGYGY